MTNIKNHIKGFTIFEVSVVLAIMSILLTVITISINRFNEQVKVSTELHETINHFYSVRSNIWQDLYNADSIAFQDNSLTLFHKSHQLTYYVKDERLFYVKNKVEVDLNVPTSKIEVTKNGQLNKYIFRFIWAEEEMLLSFLESPNLADRINAHYQAK